MPTIPSELRAEAAEKTVSVLKNRVRALLNGSTGPIEKQLERARLREEESRRKRELMAMRTGELEKHNARLESVVADRTRALTNVLDNVNFGFIIVGRDGRVREGYTRHCHALFGVEVIAGAGLDELLGIQGTSRAGDVDAALEQIFDDVLPEDLTLHQMPQHFRLSGGSSIEATPRIVRGPEGAVEGVLLTISDVTALEAARHDAQENAALVTILRNRRGFIDFLSDAREELLLVRDAVSAPDGQTLARRLVHTLKGNAGCFGLTEVQALVHEIEEAPTLLPVHAHQIEEAIRGFLARHQSVLAMDWDSQQAPAVAVPAVQLAELRRNAECGDVAAVRTWVERVQLRPAAEMMGPLDRMVAGIAQRLGKDVEFKIVGEQQRVEPNQTRPIFRNLGHLLRNAIDHGIEVPSARGAKPATATLHLELAVDANGLQIVVRDDGRGIDGQRLLERAISRGLIDGASAKALTYDDCVELVFLDGLSSADQATEFSGRGVGMSAVRAAVRQAGGRIHVRSRCGVGTEVTIRVPNARVVDCPATHPANDAVDLSRTQPHCGFADT